MPKNRCRMIPEGLLCRIPAVFSQVLLVLTTFPVPLFMVNFGQSNLYRRWGVFDSRLVRLGAVVRGSDCNFSHRVSEDHGKTFKDVTHLINHTFIQTDFGIAISPDHSGKVRYCAIFNIFSETSTFYSLERIFPHRCCLWFRWCSLEIFRRSTGLGCFARGTLAWPSFQRTCHLSRSSRCCTTPETATRFWRSASRCQTKSDRKP